MHAHDTAAEQLAAYFNDNTYGHAGALVLEQLPNGEHAWLRATEPAEDDDALYWPTESGRDLCRRWRAERWLFGREVSA